MAIITKGMDKELQKLYALTHPKFGSVRLRELGPSRPSFSQVGHCRINLNDSNML